MTDYQALKACGRRWERPLPQQLMSTTRLLVDQRCRVDSEILNDLAVSDRVGMGGGRWTGDWVAANRGYELQLESCKHRDSQTSMTPTDARGRPGTGIRLNRACSASHPRWRICCRSSVTRARIFSAFKPGGSAGCNT